MLCDCSLSRQEDGVDGVLQTSEDGVTHLEMISGIRSGTRVRLAAINHVFGVGRHGYLIKELRASVPRSRAPPPPPTRSTLPAPRPLAPDHAPATCTWPEL